MFSASVVREKGTLSWKKRFFLIDGSNFIFVLTRATSFIDIDWNTHECNSRLPLHAQSAHEGRTHGLRRMRCGSERQNFPFGNLSWLQSQSSSYAGRSLRANSLDFEGVQKEGIPFLQVPGIEADDTIGTLTKKPLRRASMLLLPLVTKTLLSSWMTTSFSLTQWVRTTAG